MQTTKTTCPYCGVGCGVLVHQNADSTITVKADKEHPANLGRLCSKGTALGETLNHPDRLLYPEINGERVDWEIASAAIAAKFQQIIAEHGPDAVAFYVSGQLLTEDYYVANKLMKGFIGSANIDTNSRLCMSSAVVAHKRAFGEDLVPCSYEDLEAAELIVLVGSNTAWCHPVLYQRIAVAKKKNKALNVVLVDPRRTQTADISDLHLPLKPGADAILFNGLLAYLDNNEHTATEYVAQFTKGADRALQLAKESSGSVEQVAVQCGLSVDAVMQFFALFASTDKVVSVFSQGINQSSSGVDKGNALINCHLLTGRIGREGMGPFSFTGQPNAMGGREVGGLANQLAAHMDIENPQHRQLVQDFWQSPSIPQQQGLKAVDLFEAIHEGKVKAVWIMATNPAVSLPDTSRVREALEHCECVVVSDCVANTDTMKYADIRLPALTWGERDGTVTNSDRTISRQRPFIPAPGEAKADWQILTEVAHKMGFEASFPYQTSLDVFREHAALSAYQNDGERCFNIGVLADISRESFDDFEPVQWPLKQCLSEADQYIPTKRLFADGKFFTPDGRANFLAIEPRPPVSVSSENYPLTLNTGRVRDHWHTLTRTGTSGRLSAHKAEAYAEIHPDDASQRHIKDGSLVRLFNTSGEMCVRAQFSSQQQVGSLFVPMHWSDAFSSQAVVGQLIPPVTDPLSGQPESKHAVVQIASYPAVWHGFILSQRKLNLENTAHYWSVRRTNNLWQYTLACENSSTSWEAFARELLCKEDETVNWVEYLDNARQTYRGARFSGKRLESCIFIGTTSDPLPTTEWLVTLFEKPEPDASERQSLLTGKPVGAVEDKGQVVCACFNVGEKTIRNAITEHKLQTVDEIGKCLQAGTNCGSCVPELRVLLG
uniref:Assimilatory nitrate reductase large subunit n=1 Tax=uncultured Thiotrichaceae bacterium TaxID=298394 RepID=A0A6S6U1H2_9GAMM|nr:MAG: Assimilatory nitrate reductase large subunit [uncultured Thiotrichaceae bacterium]